MTEVANCLAKYYLLDNFKETVGQLIGFDTSERFNAFGNVAHVLVVCCAGQTNILNVIVNTAERCVDDRFRLSLKTTAVSCRDLLELIVQRRNWLDRCETESGRTQVVMTGDGHMNQAISNGVI